MGSSDFQTLRFLLWVFTDATITEEDAGFELHVATRSIPVAIVTTMPR